jgi:hypothetical protein
MSMLYETIDGISNPTVKTKIVETKNKDGDVEDRELVTTVSFDYTGSPAAMSNVLWTLTAGNVVNVSFTSPQGVMKDIIEKQTKEKANTS